MRDEFARIARSRSLKTIQKGYANHYERRVKRYDDAKAKYDAIILQIQDLQIQRANAERFLKELEKQARLITESDEETFHALLDYITVYPREDVRFTFKDGSQSRWASKEGRKISKETLCEPCGALIQHQETKPRRFCSDRCRNIWWMAHPELMQKRAYYKAVCKYCGKEFEAYLTQSYCSKDG